MKRNLLLKNLENVNNFKIYSKTNSEYEKILGNFTLKSLIKTLKKPKKRKNEHLSKKWTKNIQKKKTNFIMNLIL